MQFINDSQHDLVGRVALASIGYQRELRADVAASENGVRDDRREDARIVNRAARRNAG